MQNQRIKKPPERLRGGLYGKIQQFQSDFRNLENQ